MEIILKKANKKLNKIINTYSFDYLLSICSTRYLLFGSYTQIELTRAQFDIENQIKNRLTLIYQIFGNEILTVWNCPIFNLTEFNSLSFHDKINIFINYCNTITQILKKISENL